MQQDSCEFHGRSMLVYSAKARYITTLNVYQDVLLYIGNIKIEPEYIPCNLGLGEYMTQECLG